MTPVWLAVANQITATQKGQVKRWQDFTLETVTDFIPRAVLSNHKWIAPYTATTDIDGVTRGGLVVFVVYFVHTAPF
jgi:hypothetical protein